MAFAMDTAQVATGHVGTLIFLGCARLTVEGAPEATTQTCPCPSRTAGVDAIVLGELP